MEALCDGDHLCTATLLLRFAPSFLRLLDIALPSRQADQRKADRRSPRRHKCSSTQCPGLLKFRHHRCKQRAAAARCRSRLSGQMSFLLAQLSNVRDPGGREDQTTDPVAWPRHAILDRTARCRRRAASSSSELHKGYRSVCTPSSAACFSAACRRRLSNKASDKAVAAIHLQLDMSIQPLSAWASSE